MENLTALRNKYIQICENVEELIEYNLGGWVLMNNGKRRQVNLPYELNKEFELDYVSIELSNVGPNEFTIKLYYTDEKLNDTIEFCDFDNWEKKVELYINNIIDNHSIWRRL